MLVVVVSAWKLRPYFQSNPIEVLTSTPLRTILHGPCQSGRLVKWVIKLTGYDIEYKSWVMATQILADFFTKLQVSEAISEDENKTSKLFVEWSSSRQGCGVGIRLETPTLEIMEQSFRLLFPTFNNEAEYEALIDGLCLAKGINA
ncbi:hypothetical protein V5N11_009011 [Cardamine amara subsp. amara]|uniref:Uncharacterized protein n=1 Tax=Cardamine amara subsp. amara TaxID=228776 RepID=A0ABD1C7B8_CARAN